MLKVKDGVILMKIGDYVTVNEIKNQSTYRWVVLVDLDFSAPYGGLEGGIIKYIEDTKTKAGKKESELSLSGIETALICGTLEHLSIGGVFVE